MHIITILFGLLLGEDGLILVFFVLFSVPFIEKKLKNKNNKNFFLSIFITDLIINYYTTIILI
jgi:hypothetical protein